MTWAELPDVETEDFTIATMPARFADVGDLHAGIDDAVCDLGVLREWVEREEREGVGEAPYPPNFPKMPGEPRRVQPSRARKRKDLDGPRVELANVKRTRHEGPMRNDVRELRTARELSQGELAQAVDVSRQTIISIEKGRYVPSLPLAFALARFFGKPVEEVFHDDQ